MPRFNLICICPVSHWALLNAFKYSGVSHRHTAISSLPIHSPCRHKSFHYSIPISPAQTFTLDLRNIQCNRIISSFSLRYLKAFSTIDLLIIYRKSISFLEFYHTLYWFPRWLFDYSSIILFHWFLFLCRQLIICLFSIPALSPVISRHSTWESPSPPMPSTTFNMLMSPQATGTPWYHYLELLTFTLTSLFHHCSVNDLPYFSSLDVISAKIFTSVSVSWPLVVGKSAFLPT